jgi:GTP cyclohydrolase I
MSTAPSARRKYDDLVLVRDISFHSHCEHHMMPFIGRAHIAYKPVGRVVGLSSSRGWSTSRAAPAGPELTPSQIATAIDEILKPHGVAVMLSRAHVRRCWSAAGLAHHHHPVQGSFRDHPDEQARFMVLRGRERSADRAGFPWPTQPFLRAGSTRRSRKGAPWRNSTPTGC